MSAESRKLQEGDLVVTDFNRQCLGKVFRIIRRFDGQGSTSGITFLVSPIVPKSNGGPMDSDWFELAP